MVQVWPWAPFFEPVHLSKHWLFLPEGHPPCSFLFMVLLPHPGWNQAPQSLGVPDRAGLKWLSTAPTASPYLNFGSLEIPTLQWHTGSHIKGSAGQCRFPAFLWAAFWSVWQSSIWLTSAWPDPAITQVPAISGASP